MQAMFQLAKNNIVQIVNCVYDKVQPQFQGGLSWHKLGEAMLLLCGKHFSVCFLFGWSCVELM